MPISRKVSEQIGRASWIRRMFEEGRALKARVGEANVYDFSLGNPIVEPPPEFFEALESVLGDHAPGLHRYMTNAGFEDTRRAVADRHCLESGLPYTSDHIVMSVARPGRSTRRSRRSSMPARKSFFCRRSSPSTSFYIDNHGGVPKIVPTTAEFDPDIIALDAAIGPQTRALILNSPNNPTGRVYGHSVVDEVARLLERKQKQFGTVIYLLSDEPYRALVYDDIDQPVIATYYANSIVCTSHSKDLGLPGERIGHIAVSPDCADAGELVNGMAFAIRTLGFVNAPAIMQRVIHVAPRLQRRRRLLSPQSRYAVHRAAWLRLRDATPPRGVFSCSPRRRSPTTSPSCAVCRSITS
jgi:aspartate aminotransferase